MHCFLYPDVFSNQIIVNDDHANILVDNFPSSCYENSTFSNRLNDNPLIAKSSFFIFFYSVISDQSFDFHEKKIIYDDYHDNEDKESHLVQSAPISKIDLYCKGSHTLILSPLAKHKLNFENFDELML